jgi:hypothetical protein
MVEVMATVGMAVGTGTVIVAEAGMAAEDGMAADVGMVADGLWLGMYPSWRCSGG